MAHHARKALHEREVEVDRKKLVETLTTNKIAHVKAYHEAIAGYKETAKKKLKADGDNARKMLDKALKRAEDLINEFSPETAHTFNDHFTLVSAVVLNLPVPQNYEEDYAAAIAISENDVRDTLVLTFAEFNCFWRDQWDWKSEFLAVHESYTSPG